MKYLHEFRNSRQAQALVQSIHRVTTRPWTMMEVCGGQTHSIIRNGIDQLLPDNLELVHGPGCPVCVTPVKVIDRAIAIAAQPEVMFCSFGDMLRVPGTTGDLLQARAAGADVRIVYSPLDAVTLAKKHPDRQVVFLAIGFETTAPANAMAVKLARQLGLTNFSLLVSHVRVPPALRALMTAPDHRVQGFLAAGHVCTVMGWQEYLPIVAQYEVPIVVTGFEPLDVLEGIRRLVTLLESGQSCVENAYDRAVVDQGNKLAQATIREVFQTTDCEWRGLGVIPQSGWCLADAYADFDADKRFDVSEVQSEESTICRSGEVLCGLIKPYECAAFGHQCTPETPLGATMVSSEGACAAYYLYGRHEKPRGSIV
ncbi:MAG: hydrogenase formation protein HypD [Planctomycetales bacterium]|nr:hydrogenase formation protein HypD [Planctomycetales bacterium]MCA9166421.1 hydrogenase formation protein HypD [Planctomycetales bacterium]